jgi:squalene synthase HpnC
MSPDVVLGAPADAASRVDSALPAQRAVPTDEAIRVRARGENFPVALRVLPNAVRDDLMAVYGFARLADELGDSYPGDRLAALDRLGADLARAVAGAGEGRAGAAAGAGEHPAVARAGAVIRRRDLPLQPFLDLVEANRQAQSARCHATFADLVDSCRLSADPVGRIVLAIFGVATPDRLALSDRVCTGLQLAEHWQDVAEDAAAGRVYLPAEDMRRFGVARSDLEGASAPPQLRALLRFEVARARAWLATGRPLVATLTGPARLAVAGFVAGGLAALDAVDAAGFDVLAGSPRPRRRRVASHAVAVWRARP